MDPVNLDHSAASVAIDPATGQPMLRIPTAKFSLTKPALEYDDPNVAIDPETGQPAVKIPRVKYFKNNNTRNQQFAADSAGAIANAPLEVNPAQVTGATGGGEDSNGGPTAMPNLQFAPGGGPQLGTPTLPKMFKPSFTSVAGPGPNGLPQPINGAETKLGKFIHILGASAQGALAGLGQTNLAAGTAAAREIPFQEQQQKQQLAQQAAQTELTKSQSQMVPTPYGPMPAGMAKLIFPAMVRAGGQVQVQGMKGQTAENVANINKRFQPVQGVGLFDTQTRSVVPGGEAGITITPEIAQDHALPKEFVGRTMTLQQLSSLQSSGPKVSTDTSTSTTDLMGNTKTVNSRLTAPVVGGAPLTPPKGGTSATPRSVILPPSGAPAAAVPTGTPQPKPAASAQTKANPVFALPPDVEQRIAGSGLKPQEQQYVRGLLSYQGQMPSPRARNYAATLATLTALDPNFNAANYDAIRKTVMDYTPGGSVGQQALAFNTAIRHIGVLGDAIDNLNNGKMQIANRLGNAIKVQFGNDEVTNFNTAKTYLAGELAKGFGGGVATDSSRSEANAILAPYQSPEQLKGGIQTAVDLLRGKVGEQENAYQNTVKRPISLLSNDAHAVLQKMGMEKPPAGVTVTDPRGSIHTFPDQQSAATFKRLAGIQ